MLRLAQVVPVDGELVDKRIGRLSAADYATAREAFRRVSSAWIR